ncbi:hypothetical protein TeGR_g7533 [Tetraparma gracilis]|uniref:MACPF domain-containing protein n=1 Tax=Tetraparma gracilis TaxID=2962635 RepID=A0ABQ6MN48_9STRA|nr:hypothetical protein TeGR_g7533 [Tetraparma gracilis]
MTSTILLLLLSLATAAASKNATTDNFLQGQGFLGHGLNIMYMNPLVGSNNNGGAPKGLTKAQSVIEFTPSDHTVKWNGNDYSCPAGVDCDVYSSCGSSSESFSAHGAKSYQESLKRSGGVSIGSTFSWFPGSFTASSSYTSTVSDMEEHSYHYFYAKATCAMYHLKLRDFTTDVSVTDEFKAGVASLSNDDDGTFYRVIEAFGTHYTTAVLIGGQMTKEDWFTEETVQHAESEGKSFEEMAKVSYSMIGGSEQYSTEKQTECKEEYDAKRAGTQELYVGGAAFTDGGISEWYEALVGDLESVAPIGSGIEIMPICELMTAQYFPDDKDIVGKKAKMEKMLESYCEWLGENGQVCLLKPEDKEPTSDIKTEDLEGGPNNWEAAEVAIGTKVYRFGGYDGSNTVSTTSLYDAAMGKWDEAKVQQLPEARYDIGAAAVGDDIFLFGGGDGTIKSEVLKYSTARDSFAVMAPMDKPMGFVTAAAVTTEDGTANIFYGSSSSDIPGFFVYEPSADKHTVIDADISNINCLTSSNDGESVWGLVDKHLYTIDASTGAKTTFSDNEFPSDISDYGSQCAMTSDGFFYFLNDSGIWYMDTAEDGDKKWSKTGVVPSHPITFGYSAVMIQDTLLITSMGYTDAISTTPQARAAQRLSLEQ